MAELIRVLVIDDSAYVRKVVSQMLSRSPFIQVVGIARDGQEGLELAKELAPDVITCDLNMPVMDGVSFVQAQMGREPIPIVIISIAAESGEQVLAALDAGAVDFVQKPTALATEKLGDIARDLVEKVKAAGSSRGRRIVTTATTAAPVATAVLPSRGVYDVVVIGVSTGGPQGLKAVIPQLPADFRVPIAMVLHMPIGYTEMYAQKLDALSSLHVVEAADGQEVTPGTVYLAPAGKHLRIPTRQAEGVHASRHPAARLAAPAFRRRAVPVRCRGVWWPHARSGHDRDGQRWPRGCSVDQGPRRLYPYGGRGNLRGVWDAPIRRRRRAE